MIRYVHRAVLKEGRVESATQRDRLPCPPMGRSLRAAHLGGRVRLAGDHAGAMARGVRPPRFRTRSPKQDSRRKCERAVRSQRGATRMKALIFREHGGPEVLEVV